MKNEADALFRNEIIKHMQSLRAFAISLCGNVTRAEDLVQETVLRALANQSSFQPGTNMGAWLFTILRNHFRSQYRKQWREVEDTEGHYTASLIDQPSQEKHIEFADFREALETLPADQREALILVGASGFSYEEAASICRCAVGTIKSRVNRARTRLLEILSYEPRELNKQKWEWDDEKNAPTPQKLYGEAPKPIVVKSPVVTLLPLKTPDLVLEGIEFVLERVESLADGKSRSYYRAL